ncbi:conjugative transposon protein TraM [Hymenobacter sp. GOD-10R]|uniref:conjugative transposon protein TraM n=1 Tax=Hymenobacter sp. GOD-10R TaxID=3093922 RepID=UPI002D7874CF|nr:conjugative transposon protein TraM [Hymenobacter sp. GOD-10R]WRQ31607.1 conjugative transposon protein TraM [Hymenobacter sp. GOD-10R]
MSAPKLTQEFIKKRRLLLFIPLPSVIFLTILFVLGGGGKGVPTAEAGAGMSGLNTSLPSAGKTVLFGSKLDAYAAPQDSTHHNGLAFTTPPAPLDTAAAAITSQPTTGLNYAVQPGQPSQAYDPKTDPNVAAMQSRMQRTQQQLYAPEPAAYSSGSVATSSSYGSSSAKDEQMDQSLRELDQLRQQYEKRLQDLDKPAPAATPAAPVAAASPKSNKPAPSVVAAEPVSVVNRLQANSSASGKGNSFHGLGGTSHSTAAVNAVPAVVHSDQVVVQGQTVKLRLLADVQLEGRVIPANTFVYGVCGLSGQRLTITINSIQYDNSIVPVSLSAYDLDGGEGLNIPGSVDRDAAKQSMANGASSADLLTMSPSLGAQAAGIAIQTGKAIAGNKIKLVKINLKANYKLLLQ